MGHFPVIDTDGHVLERQSDIRKYLEAPWNKRPTPLWPGDQPWDNDLMDSFEMARQWKGLSATEQVERWHAIMDEHNIEKAICFPTGSGNIAKNQEVPYQIAVARASNTHFAKEYNDRSDRLFCVGCLPMRSPAAAAAELNRGVKELGLKGFEVLPTGLPLALGDTFYDPIYAEAEKLGAVLGIHGTRNTSRELGTSGLATFSEVHSYAFPVGILLQFTSMVCQGLTIRFPKLKLAFLEIGATWLPYYLDRLDEHWEKRGEYEMPLLKTKPSDVVRQSKMYFSVEPGESQLAATIDYVGAEHFLYASDIPHWDNEFPENLIDLRDHRHLSDDAKRKILYENAKELFAL
ncbi:MAG TPA: amidohydrolase family protein [Candidatus Polarisedimenticolaceae bacterium]|nr:amidohydrolase family protein [Candidatus Polarisedimenticolaceae bacterium]